MTRFRALTGALLAFSVAGSPAGAQEWRELAARVGPTARVLLVGTRPEDEDNALIAWLSLGRNIETAYLSLTRGEAGVNVIGAERQASLAVLRTAELLAERERDKAHQYFTSAYDFGATDKDSIVAAGWPAAALLNDVVSVVRAFRPHVIISLADANDRDATRRFTAGVAARAFAAAGDTTIVGWRSTSRMTSWTVSRLFTRVEAPSAEWTVVPINVGEFDRRSGRSYAEIGADIRRLQRSQPASTGAQIGRVDRYLRMDSTRSGDAASLFGSLDTSLARVREIPANAATQLDSLRSALADFDAARPAGDADSIAVRLARIAARTSGVRLAMRCADTEGVPACPGALGDLAVSLNTIRERATQALLGAAGVVIEGTPARELVAAGDTVRIAASVYNGGAGAVIVRRLAVSTGPSTNVLVRDASVVVPADSTIERSATMSILAPSYHWWQINGLVPDTWIHDFKTSVVSQLIAGEDRIAGSRVEATVAIGGVDVPVIVKPLAFRGTTTARGDQRRPLAGVPAVSLLLERTDEYERAGQPIDRLFRVYVWSAQSRPDTLEVTLTVPPGLKVDTATRKIVLPPFSARNIYFRLRGRLRAGTDPIAIAATARSAASRPTESLPIARVDQTPTFTLGVVVHEYPHVPSQRFVRFASDRIEAVDLRVPPALRVAYVKGAEDLQTPLTQLRIPVQSFETSLLSAIDLSGFSTILIGPDALSSPILDDAVPALSSYVRGGGTIVMLGDADAAVRSGLLPYPITVDRADRVSNATTTRLTDASAQLVTWPNAISAKDAAEQTVDPTRGVLASVDPRYRSSLSLTASDQKPLPAVITARVGKGTVVYTSLPVDQQLAAVNAAASRLIVNLLSAGLSTSPSR